MLQTLLFLKSEYDGVTVFDPTEPEIDQNHFPIEDWSVTPFFLFKEDVPSNAPIHRGTCFTIRAFFTLIILETMLLVS